MADSAVPAADATAGGGWRIGPLPPEPIPPEVLELLDGELFRLLEGFVLTAPPGSGPGTIELRLHEPPSRGRPLLVVLREGQPPDLIDPIGDHGTALFRFEAGAHDGGARLLLLAVRTVVATDIRGADAWAADTEPAPERQAPQAPPPAPLPPLPGRANRAEVPFPREGEAPVERGFEPQLAALGGRLTEAVLPEELRRHLNAAWGRLDWFAILSTEMSVPWELAQTPLEAEFLARLGATAVDPGDFAALSALLRGGGFAVLHFGGHGASDDAGQRLLLVAAQDACGSSPASALSADFPRRRPHPGAKPGLVVVLNACRLAATPRTGADAFASAFLAGGAGAFAGCLWSVGDRPALGFAKAFYAALREGSTVSAAVRAARLAARAAGDASWLANTAYAHPPATVDFSS